MVNIDLSKRVKEIRAKIGLSQEQLADISGLSIRTIQRIENGEAEPRGDTLRRLAKALQVTTDELIDCQKTEDMNVLTMLNLSQFTFLAFPLLGILIPLILWIFKKDTVKDVKELGKAIINFQISWVILLFVFGISFFIIDISHFAWPFSFEGTLTSIVGCLYGFNVLAIVINEFRIIKRKAFIYKPSLNFIR
jgi:transcriptional regulator with XRE-family HTH domain